MFGADGPIVMPVIHALDKEQVYKNVSIAMDQNVAGIFLINHDFGIQKFLPIIKYIRAKFDRLWIGINFLAVTGRDAFPILEKLNQENILINGYWADDACIDEQNTEQIEAEKIAQVRENTTWSGIYFGGTAFKKQRPVKPQEYKLSAEIATRYMDVVTTSGPATGIEAGVKKIETFRDGVGNNALALASGITPENAQTYRQVDFFLVSTGINLDGDFYNIDTTKLSRLLKEAKDMENYDK